MNTASTKENPNEDIRIPRKLFLLWTWIALLFFIAFIITDCVQSHKNRAFQKEQNLKNRESYERIEQEKLDFEKQKWQSQQ